MHVLVTGGAGYIGSHTTVELLRAGHRVTVLDNLDNASRVVIDRIKELACAHDEGSAERLRFEEVDLLDIDEVRRVFRGTGGNDDWKVDAVIHFAGLKAVGESVSVPLRYYENNIVGTLRLLEVMREVNCRRLVFSSSATVYGDPAEVPVTVRP